MTFRSLCVFCGSRTGRRADYEAAATALGTVLAQRQITLVYGGGSVGLMGALATAALAAAGRVVGVIPEALAAKEVAHGGVTEMHVVPSMHVRKALMAELSEGFIALPGGFGTFEELFEIVTWSQLGIHGKPVGLLNVGGYFDQLLAMVDHATREGFIDPDQRAIFVEADRPDVLLERLERHQPPPAMAWVRPEET
jgi:uncharacterized protein (TIGR00730 family)